MSDDSQDPDELLQILGSVKSALDVLGRQKTDIEGRLITILDAAGKTNIASTKDGRTIKGTVVRAERVSIDAEALEKALAPKVWQQVSKRVLDNGLLEAAVTMKVVDENLVATHSEIKQNKPYIKVSGDLPTIIGLEQVVTVADSGKEKPAMKRVKAKIKAAKAVAR